jgi:four helix bundle protein
MLYENMDVWKRSRKLTIEVYKTLSQCRDYGFKDQITRSALSVPSNIAEGCERRSIKERVRFLDIAKGSLGEFKTQADIGIEVGYIVRGKGMAWLKESDELARMLASLMARLKNSSI